MELCIRMLVKIVTVLDIVMENRTLLGVLLLLLTVIDTTFGIFGTQCAKNPNVAADAPRNTYFCPFENPDGTENPYTECCYNDRPDEDGHYYSCCKSDEDLEGESNSELKRLGLIIGGIAAVIFSCVFVFTYCRADTFPFVARIKSRVVRWWQWLSDHVCFCLCCEKTFQRKEKKEDAVGAAHDNTTFELW